ncbi:MAG: hypothetical protein QE271_09255 [Bacteriovoracaceae bacterium]|nr:hypothetical protein [Bacteriovoracaceae bacterium]
MIEIPEKNLGKLKDALEGLKWKTDLTLKARLIGPDSNRSIFETMSVTFTSGKGERRDIIS